MKRNLTALTLALLLALTGVGCGEEGVSENTTAGNDGTTSPSGEESIYDSLPTGDYGGAEFNILNHSYTYAEYRLDAESQTGETFNDTVYNRTREVEERLKVKIKVRDMDYWSEDAQSEIMNLVMAGDDVYDCCFLGAAGNMTAITGGIYLDLSSVKEFDFTKPWWDKKSVSYYEMGGKVYTALNEATMNIHDQMWATFFNKQIAEELKLENIYDLVKDGKWTLDKMAEFIEIAANDLDGDGTLGENDRWGMMTNQKSSFGLLHGANARVIDKKNGVPTFMELDDHLLGALEKVRKIFSLEGTMNQSALGYDCNKGFSNGNSLLLIEVIGNAAKLRGMDVDFGIIPHPKYDEAQDGYVAYHSPAANGVCIPKTCSDVSRAGTVIEVMSALGYKYVRPAYYDVVLNGKTVRDDESSEMLDIIFDNVETDYAQMYKWAGFDSTMISVMTTSVDIASTFDSNRKAVEAAISEFLENIK